VQAQENIQRLGQKQTQGAFDIARFYESAHPPEPRAAFIYYNEVVREDPNSEQAQIAKKRIQALKPAVEALPGGLGPDGSGNPATPQKVASGPAAPGTSGAVPLDTTGGPVTNSAPQDVNGGALPADPNAPVTTSSPGETAAGDTMTNAPSTNAPASAPVAAPADKTPLPEQ